MEGLTAEVTSGQTWRRHRGKAWGGRCPVDLRTSQEADGRGSNKGGQQEVGEPGAGGRALYGLIGSSQDAEDSELRSSLMGLGFPQPPSACLAEHRLKGTSRETRRPVRRTLGESRPEALMA